MITWCVYLTCPVGFFFWGGGVGGKNLAMNCELSVYYFLLILTFTVKIKPGLRFRCYTIEHSFATVVKCVFPGVWRDLTPLKVIAAAELLEIYLWLRSSVLCRWNFKLL